LAAHFAPAPLSEKERRALDRSLAKRLVAGRPAWRSFPILVAAATAAALAVLAVPALFVNDGSLPAREGRTESFASAEWESGLFETTGFSEADGSDEFDDLPDDYAAIAGLLLGS
jgi:hypothetical protein